jgi:hypothetical protein
MFDSKFLDRFHRLIAVRIDERKVQFPQECGRLAANLTAKGGTLQSGAHVHLSQKLHSQELEARAILTWETLVRVHRTLGSQPNPSLREDFKTLLSAQLDADFPELTESFAKVQKQSGMVKAQISLADAKNRTQAKHEIEIDLYVDSLEGTDAAGGMTSPTYHFYGNVGAVQTGVHAIANTVQNLGGEDRAALAEALTQVHEALAVSTMHEQQKFELLELAKEAQMQLASVSPNNTKLMSTFNVLATSVQAISSAQPAYQALKLAVLPLGITLP